MIVSDRKNIFKKHCKISLNFYVSDFRKIGKLKKFEEHCFKVLGRVLTVSLTVHYCVDFIDPVIK